MKALTFLHLIFLSLAALAEDARVATLIARGDADDKAHRTREALAAFREADQLAPENVGILLRLSKQYSDLVGETKPESAAKAVAEKALACASRAASLDPKSAKAHLSLAICYGKLTDFVGNKQKVEYSRLIRDEAQRSIELDPTDDFAWHVLGRWHFGVANVSPVLRALAKLVYGGVPAASNAEAVRHLKKACELAPQRIIHHSELARIYREMGERDLELREWQAVLALPAVDKEDERDQTEARKAVTSRSGKAIKN